MKKMLFLLNTKIVFIAGGAFLGLALSNDNLGAIIGGVIGFILSLRLK